MSVAQSCHLHLVVENQTRKTSRILRRVCVVRVLFRIILELLKVFPTVTKFFDLSTCEEGRKGGRLWFSVKM